MLTRLQSNNLFSKVLLGSYTNGFPNLSCGSQFSRAFNETAKHGLSTMSSCDNSMNPPNRNYQVVVAATREMGIGKDGKLPWRLPSDLKFFKKLTVTTSDPEKKNVVLMGRKTWESIPFEYRPLPGRLNVVLTRSDITTGENVVICRSISSALEPLAQVPYRSSIEKVFVIGGGQIFRKDSLLSKLLNFIAYCCGEDLSFDVFTMHRETLNAPGCEAIHITEIDTSVESDTFIPLIDLSCFRLWYSSDPVVENGIRFSFATYIRVRSGATVNPKSTGFEVKDFTFLPRMILERHDELN